MIDPNVGLAARNNLLFIADHWADLRARLRPGGGNALTGMPSGTSEGHCPIDVHVSDLLREIEDETRMLGHVLMDETNDWTPRTSRMPALLGDVAARYGHWTAGDERTALAFCGWAEQYAGKVRAALERPAPPEYVGPCRSRGVDGCGCSADLYLRHGRDSGTCRECGTPFTRDEQDEYVQGELAARLMTATEIRTALCRLGHTVSTSTVRVWVHRGRLVPSVEDPTLYRLEDAMALVERQRVSA